MKKKYLICLITFIFAIISTINVSIGIYARQYVKYEFEVNNEVKIDNVVINNTTIPLTRYINDKLRIDKDGKLVSKEDTKVTIVASKVDDVFVNFDTEDYSKINVLKDGEIQNIDNSLYSSTNSMKNIVSYSVKHVGYYVILIFIGSYVLLLGCFIMIKNVMKKLKGNNVKLFDAIKLVVSVFLVYFLTFYVMLATIREIVLLPIIITIFAGIYYLRDTIKDNLQNAYLYIAVIAGITMLFIIPPFNVPDEGAHYKRSFIETEARARGDMGYNKFPVSIDNFMYKYYHGSHSSDTTYSGKNYFSDMFEVSDYNNLTEYNIKYSNTKFLSVFTYIPSILVMFIGKILKFSPLVLLLLGRLIDLIIVILSCYIAIKHIPCFKKVVFCVALFPMMLQQAAAINQDFMTNSIALLTITYILKMVYGKDKITKKDNILTLVLSILLGICKLGYFPIFFLLLLVPKEKIENKKVFYIVVILSLMLSFGSSFYINRAAATRVDSPYYTIKEALSAPIDTVKIFFSTALDRFSLDIFRGLFDGFGVSTQWHYGLFLFILTVIYAVLLFVNDENDKKLTKKERIIFLLTSFIIMLILYASLFIGWTYKGAKVIDGLQPRYFIPAAFIFYIGLSNSKIILNVKNKNMFYAYGVCIVYLISFATIFLGFY